MVSTGPLFLSATRVVPLLSLTGVVLDALGGLYLAYDLLGGKDGPLRPLSRLLTYSAILGLGYGATLGLGFGLAGALVSGPTIQYELRRRAGNSTIEHRMGFDGLDAWPVVRNRRMAGSRP